MDFTYPLQSRKLTKEEELLMEVVDQSNRIPGGAQIAVDLSLEAGIVDLDKLFTERGLPRKDELIDKLTEWHANAKQGLQLWQQYDRLMRQVIETIASTVKPG